MGNSLILNAHYNYYNQFAKITVLMIYRCQAGKMYCLYFMNSYVGTPIVNPRVQYRNQLSYVGKLKACVFDWSGTVVDCGVFGPTVVFMEVFKNEGVPITIKEARAPMGTHKKVINIQYCVVLN